MEHIVQFGINIDDEAIKRTIEKQALNVAIGQIVGEYKKVISPSGNYSNKIKDIVNENVQNLLEENKEQIIEMVVERLTDRLVRTKAVKDAISKSLEALI